MLRPYYVIKQNNGYYTSSSLLWDEDIRGAKKLFTLKNALAIANRLIELKERKEGTKFEILKVTGVAVQSIKILFSQ